MATSPTSGPGGGGGGGDLAATLALGNDADGDGIDNLGDSTMDGGSWIFDGDNEEYPRGPGTEAGETGGAAASLYFSEPGASGTGGAEAHLTGGSGQVAERIGGAVRLTGGNGRTAGGGSTSGAQVEAAAGDTTDPGLVSVRTGGSSGVSGQALVSNGATAVAWDDLGAIKLDTHAAPADGTLAAGELRLWFDQTDGVGNTKLMVKAKSADGTVKTATIVLA